ILLCAPVTDGEEKILDPRRAWRRLAHASEQVEIRHDDRRGRLPLDHAHAAHRIAHRRRVGLCACRTGREGEGQQEPPHGAPPIFVSSSSVSLMRTRSSRVIRTPTTCGLPMIYLLE